MLAGPFALCLWSGDVLWDGAWPGSLSCLWCFCKSRVSRHSFNDSIISAPVPCSVLHHCAAGRLMSGRKFRRKQAPAGSRGGDVADGEDAEEEPGSLALPPAAAAARRPEKVLVYGCCWLSWLAI